ncbi:hypothetical protein LCGC14_1112110 [marine sediment metagenome]|uniref:Uncharacterized protein n=1 Tax=marine sediment metagenome TaxID=412755 RepID=A0A0F9PPK2_9ZZZZ
MTGLEAFVYWSTLAVLGIVILVIIFNHGNDGGSSPPGGRLAQ